MTVPVRLRDDRGTARSERAAGPRAASRCGRRKPRTLRAAVEAATKVQRSCDASTDARATHGLDGRCGARALSRRRRDLLFVEELRDERRWSGCRSLCDSEWRTWSRWRYTRLAPDSLEAGYAARLSADALSTGPRACRRARETTPRRDAGDSCRSRAAQPRASTLDAEQSRYAVSDDAAPEGGEQTPEDPAIVVSENGAPRSFVSKARAGGTGPVRCAPQARLRRELHRRLIPTGLYPVASLVAGLEGR